MSFGVFPKIVRNEASFSVLSIFVASLARLTTRFIGRHEMTFYVNYFLPNESTSVDLLIHGRQSTDL